MSKENKLHYDKKAGRWRFHCPGCKTFHEFDKGWHFNGDLEKPTVSPSIRVNGTVPITDDQHAQILAGEKFEPKPFVCHSYIRDGKIEFLDDSSHELKGQTVEIPIWEGEGF